MREVGEIFIEPADAYRIEEQTEWAKMFDGTKIYNTRVKDGKKEDCKPLVPIASVISEINADLLFGEFPDFDFQNEAQTKAVVDTLPNRFITEIIETATFLSAIGRMFCVFYKMQDKIYWKWVQSDICLWEESERGLEEFTIIASKKVKDKFTIYELQEYDYKYNEELFTSPFDDQIRSVFIYRYSVKVDNATGEIKAIIDFQEPELLPWKVLPVLYVDNTKNINQNIGKSDYQRKEGLFGAVDRRIDQINAVLEEHSDPWIALPPGVLNKNGQFDRSKGKMFEKTSTGNNDEISVTQWDARLDNAYEMIDKLIEMILFTTRISPALAGYTKGGIAESGRALKWRMVSTIAMVNRKRRYWDDFFYAFFEMLKLISPDYAAIDPLKLIVRWKDGLPVDLETITQDITSQVQSKLMSRLKGIETLQELDEEKARLELVQIDEESRSDAEIQASSSGIQI